MSSYFPKDIQILKWTWGKLTENITKVKSSIKNWHTLEFSIQSRGPPLSVPCHSECGEGRVKKDKLHVKIEETQCNLDELLL